MEAMVQMVDNGMGYNMECCVLFPNSIDFERETTTQIKGRVQKLKLIQIWKSLPRFEKPRFAS